MQTISITLNSEQLKLIIQRLLLLQKGGQFNYQSINSHLIIELTEDAKNIHQELFDWLQLRVSLW